MDSLPNYTMLKSFSKDECRKKLNDLSQRAKIAARFRPVHHHPPEKFMKYPRSSRVEIFNANPNFSVLPIKSCPTVQLKRPPPSVSTTRSCLGSNILSLDLPYPIPRRGFSGKKLTSRMLSSVEKDKGKLMNKAKEKTESSYHDEFRSELNRANLDFRNRTKVFNTQARKNCKTVHFEIPTMKNEYKPPNFLPKIQLPKKLPDIPEAPVRVQANAQLVKDKMNKLIEDDKIPNEEHYLEDPRYLDLVDNLVTCKKNEFMRFEENQKGQALKTRFVNQTKEDSFNSWSPAPPTPAPSLTLLN